MGNLKLRIYDGIAIASFLMLPALFSTEISQLVSKNSTATWIVLLVAFVIMLCFFIIISSLFNRYEGKNIIEITSIVMGRPFGVIYGVILSVYFCYFTGIHIREITIILKLYGLEFTPIYIIAGLILLTAIIMNFFGGRAIIKSAGLFFIIIIIGIVFIVLLGVNRYNPYNLAPIFGNGITDILKNSLSVISVFDCVTILFLFAPSFSNTVKMKKSGIISIAITALSYILFSLCFIMMFSNTVVAKLVSGFIEIGKSSYYNHFFYRFESILLFFLIFSFVMLASIGLFISKEIAIYTFKLKPTKIITIICALFILIAIFIPTNILDLTQKYLPIIRNYSVVFMVGFPLLVLIISFIKRVFKYEKN